MCSSISRIFLIITYAFYCFAAVNELESAEEKQAEKYIAKEDAEEMRRQMSDYGEGYGTDWVMIPDGDGNPQVAMLKENKGHKFFGFGGGSETREEPAAEHTIGDDVHFMLYNRNNPKQGETISATPESISSSSYDPSKPTKIIVHGWKSSGDSDTVLKIKDAYMERSDMNVVGVDWSSISSNYYYPTPAAETSRVGQHVGRLIDTMVESRGARHEDFHIIGHSLGAHVAGAAGSNTKKKVSRITGLDPALPGFQYYQATEGRLDDTDAEFVEVIHTCSGALGMSAPAGHADFYPNGGSPFQPGCCCMPEFTEACSHGRAHQYFAESITSDTGFEATHCDTWDQFKHGACPAEVVKMGEATPPTTRGVYYLLTNSSAPYAMGAVGAKYTADGRK